MKFVADHRLEMGYVRVLRLLGDYRDNLLMSFPF